MVETFIIQKSKVFSTYFLHLANSNYTIHMYHNLRLLVAKSDVGTKLGARMKYGPPILHILDSTIEKLNFRYNEFSMCCEVI